MSQVWQKCLQSQHAACTSDKYTSTDMSAGSALGLLRLRWETVEGTDELLDGEGEAAASAGGQEERAQSNVEGEKDLPVPFGKPAAISPSNVD